MATKRPELVPYQVRVAVRNAIGGWGPYKFAEVDELFIGHGFVPTLGEYDQSHGVRANEADKFHAAIDWTDPEQVSRYLHLIEDVLDANSSTDFRPRYDALLRVLGRAGLEPDDKGRIRLPAPPVSTLDASRLPTESDIRLHLARLERLDQEPEEMIGAAKELIEATAKYVMLTLGAPIDPNADLGALSKDALAQLNLHPTSLAPTSKGVESMKRVLGGLGQIAAGMAELRNLYGTGHGRGQRVKGLQARHAEFAARSAISYAAFVLDTLADPDAPWRVGTPTTSQTN
jgi:hypothetical protein